MIPIMTQQLTTDEIRSALVKRAEAYAQKHGVSLSRIGLAAVNDTKFLHRVKNGENFNIGTYHRVVEWLSANEPRGTETAA